jgi:hypothetical protein
MPVRNLIAAALLACAAPAAWAAEIEGVRLDDRIALGASGQELLLNGAGLRTRFFFDVYVAALYLAQKQTAAAEAIALPGAKRVALRLLRNVSAKTLLDALNEGMQANNSAAELDALKTQLGELAALMNAIGEAKKGDSVALDFDPQSGTRVSLNGKELGKPIAGAEFYRALLRVWLGDKPVQDNLKRALLGAPQ